MSEADILTLIKLVDREWSRLDRERQRTDHLSPLYRTLLEEQQHVEALEQKLVAMHLKVDA